MLLSGGAMGLTLGIGYVNHQLQTWALERPVMPAPMTQFAVTLPGGPALAGQMAQAQAEERRTDEDDVERQWRNAVVRFCVIGMTYGDMGYPRMKHHVDRTGWDTITRELESAKVLRIGAGRRPTQFAAGWDLPRLRVSIKREWITLPCPAPDEIPVVKW
jgi:hypothetical protein